jgi:hypothetical protein
MIISLGASGHRRMIKIPLLPTSSHEWRRIYGLSSL